MKEILEYNLFEIGEYRLTVYSLVILPFIYLGVKVVLFFIRKALNRNFKSKKIDSGNGYAIFQIISYLIWVAAIVLAMETMGVKVTILIASSAALLVGIGLGLQQTFNDIISGIILLIEGTTKIGDVLQVDGEVVKVQKIGLRASIVIDRDDIIMIIPNSLIVTSKVVNWSHQGDQTRFRIQVGVAYGSDVELVMRLMEESAAEHDLCSKDRGSEARFINFGESSLDFELLFWSSEKFRIPKVMSDIRRAIDRKFRENKVTIPFPQRDLHLKTNETNLGPSKP